jgi:hypothetical protein
MPAYTRRNLKAAPILTPVVLSPRLWHLIPETAVKFQRSSLLFFLYAADDAGRSGQHEKTIVVALMITLLPATAYSQKGSQPT